MLDAATIVSDGYACFETKLETTLKSEIGAEPYEKALQQVKSALNISKNEDVEKSPYAMKELLSIAAATGCRSATLAQIVHNVSELSKTSSIVEEPVKDKIDA